MSALNSYLAYTKQASEKSYQDMRRFGLAEEQARKEQELQEVRMRLRIIEAEQKFAEQARRGNLQEAKAGRDDLQFFFSKLLEDEEGVKKDAERHAKDANTELDKLKKSGAKFSDPAAQLTTTAGKLLAAAKEAKGESDLKALADALFAVPALFEVTDSASVPALSPVSRKHPNFLVPESFLGRLPGNVNLDSSPADIRKALGSYIDSGAIETTLGYLGQFRDQKQAWLAEQKRNKDAITEQEGIASGAAAVLSAETPEQLSGSYMRLLRDAGELKALQDDILGVGVDETESYRSLTGLYGGDAGGLSPMQKHMAAMGGQMPPGVPQENATAVQQLVATQKRLSTDPSFLKWAAQNGISVQRDAVVPVNVFMRWNNEVIGKGRLGWRYKGKRGRDLRGTGAVFEVTYRAGDDFDIGLRSAGGAQLFAIDEDGDYLSPDRVSNKHRDDFAEAQVVTADLDDAQTRGEIVSLLSTAGEGGREMAKAIGQAYAGDSKGDFQVFLDKSGKAALVGANGRVVKTGGFDAETAALSDAARDVNGPFVVAGTSSAMQDRMGGNALGNLDGFAEGQTADFGVYVPKGLRLVTKEPTATLIAEEALHRAGSPGDETVYFWDDKATGTRQSITLKDESTTGKELFDAKQQLERGDNRFRVLGRERRRVKLAKRMSPADPAARRARTPGSLEVRPFTADELRKRKEAPSAPPELAPTPAPAAPEAEPPVVEEPPPVTTDAPELPKKPSGKKPSGTRPSGEKPRGTADLMYVPEGFEAKPAADVADVTQTIDEATSRSVVAESDPETGAQTVRTDLMRDADAERERLERERERERERKRQRLIAAGGNGAASGGGGG